MNDIIKKIEDAQLKAEAPEFRVGDTVKVYGKIKEGNRERIPEAFFRPCRRQSLSVTAPEEEFRQLAELQS